MASVGLRLCCGGAIVASVVAVAAAQPSPASPVASDTALINKYCIACHNERAKTGGLVLEKADLSTVSEKPETWEKVIRKLRGGSMPPQGMPRPDRKSIDALVSFLETRLDEAAQKTPNPGRSVLRRLNRTEYANAIRDLLDLDVDINSLLPPDDAIYGFDNNADTLGVSPIVLERYLSASGKISRLALGDPSTPPSVANYRARQDLAQEDHIEGLPLGTRGGMAIHHDFPADGEYVIKVTLARNNSAVIRGLDYQHEFELVLDGARVQHAPVGGKEDWEAADRNPTAAADTIEGRLQKRLVVKAGMHTVGATFAVKTMAPRDELLDPFMRSNIDPREVRGVPVVDSIVISGPFNVSSPGESASRRKIMICRPAAGGDELSCAKRILSNILEGAYRRPITNRDLETPLRFYREGRASGDFDKGIEFALRFVLASPDFVFRLEFDPDNAAPNTPFRVSDIELASRLSFFLWSSIPDKQLVDVALRGKLKDPEILEQQVRRMLADSRSSSLATNFAAQWLYLRNLKAMFPDPDLFPNFDDNLRQAMVQETEMFFEGIVREDRSVLDLLNANYTFVNDRLAKHYGLPNIYGSQFRRVTLTDDYRRGLLGQGAILTVTSYANRTSPVLRGKWILENLLGTPPPPPPPNVPPLKENTPGGAKLSVRQRLEEHRANAACATCHRVMDPLGFALENFDAVGRWRTESEAGTAIDASGQLADGTPIDGIQTLRAALMSRPDMFVGTMTEKLLTFALGRGLEYYDIPTVREVTREAGRNQYRFSALILAIVNSTPFQMKMPDGARGEQLAARVPRN